MVPSSDLGSHKIENLFATYQTLVCVEKKYFKHGNLDVSQEISLLLQYIRTFEDCICDLVLVLLCKLEKFMNNSNMR